MTRWLRRYWRELAAWAYAGWCVGVLANLARGEVIPGLIVLITVLAVPAYLVGGELRHALVAEPREAAARRRTRAQLHALSDRDNNLERDGRAVRDHGRSR